MPLLSITTNKSFSPDEQSNLILDASALVSNILGKPERYVMILLQESMSLIFSGTNDPCAYVELKSIGLDENGTSLLSEKLCSFLSQATEIPSDRIYIEFTNAERHMWGWNEKTF